MTKHNKKLCSQIVVQTWHYISQKVNSIPNNSSNIYLFIYFNNSPENVPLCFKVSNSSVQHISGINLGLMEVLYFSPPEILLSFMGRHSQCDATVQPSD